MSHKTKTKQEPPSDCLKIHHIDTCVMLNYLEADDNKFGIIKKPSDDKWASYSYFAKLGEKNKGFLSLPVLGEILGKLLSPKYSERREDYLNTLQDLKSKGKLEIMCVFELQTAKEFLGGLGNLSDELDDSRLDSTDVQILLCAIDRKAGYLITTDTKFLDSQKLIDYVKQKYNLAIVHPRYFLKSE